MPPKKKKKRRSRARGSQRPSNGAATRAESVEPADPNEKRRERIQARREAKARALQAQQRRAKARRLARLSFMAGILILVGWFLFFRNQIPEAIAGHPVRAFDSFSTESRQGSLHTQNPVTTYESDPPVSGPHNPNPAACGVHSSQIPNENMVHTLEHGAVGILYRPGQGGVDVGEIRTLEGIVGDFDSHVFSEPYPSMDNAVTVIAWAHMMRLETVDESAIREFIDVFRAGGQAPEANQECPNQIDEPFEPAVTPTSTAPPEEPSGAGGGGDGNGGGKDKDKDKKKKSKRERDES